MGIAGAGNVEGGTTRRLLLSPPVDCVGEFDAALPSAITMPATAAVSAGTEPGP